MSNITIIDTGYGNVESTGTIFDNADRANSGSAIELKGVTITYDRTVNLDVSSGPDNSTESEVNQVSNETPKLLITGVVRRGDGDYTDGNMSQLPFLDQCAYTKGIKCVYYNDAIADTTGYPLLTKFLGGTDAFTGHPSEKHFHARFKGFRVVQSASGKLYTFTLTGEVTA